MTTTNDVLKTLIDELKIAAAKQDAPIWRAIASDLERPSRNRRAVNLSRINRYTSADEVVVVPGKVLSMGELDHKVTIAAFQFSLGAKQKIQRNGNAISIRELIAKHPTGKDVKIIG